MKASAIVLAAGEGRRFAGDIAKPYLSIAGRPLVLRTLDRVFSASSVESVIVVVAAEQRERCESLLRSDAALRDRAWVLETGGVTRQQSAWHGLQRVPAHAGLVLIHDAARPLVSAGLIDRCVEKAAEKHAVVAGLPVRDTIKSVLPDHRIESTLDRSVLWEIQTPQVFKRELIVAAHEQAARAGSAATDDAMLVERVAAVYVVAGERTNFKITVMEDLWLAEALIREGRAPQ